MKACCQQTDKSKKLNYKRIAVANVVNNVKVDPTATTTDVCLAPQLLSPSRKVMPGLARPIRSVVKFQ